jgi:hypothetical protein
MTLQKSIGWKVRSCCAACMVVIGCMFAAKLGSAADADSKADPLAWPKITSQTKPWTRWWWLGSAVDKENLSSLLEQYRDAGIGGVEICPIYGAKGYEQKFLDFLSPQWVEMLGHTTTEGKRLGMGVDMTTGTGWPFGGPKVTADEASGKVNLVSHKVAGGAKFSGALPAGKIQCVRAISGEKQIDLTDKVTDGKLDWTAPEGEWKVYAVAEESPVQKVKRSAPGGVGNVLDPFSPDSLGKYLKLFDDAFADFKAPRPRSEFHDSYEYYNATWTPKLFDEFQKRRGYDLREHLPALFDEGPADTVARVKCDYRETLSDLHLDYIKRWTEWAHSHGELTRNQAHGGPGNLIDTYAACDIPEMEIFKAATEQQIPMMKFAPSATHVTGRTLASSESFTWLGEHFQVPLSRVKTTCDFFFLSGINHIFFHGIPYSPKDAAWPGWQFYAAVNFGPGGGLWRDLPAFNAYVARCQSMLQAGKPANDVLLYFGFYEMWQNPRGLVIPFNTEGTWMEKYPVHDAAMTLWNRGFGFDEVSDRILAEAKVENGNVESNGVPYRAIVVARQAVIPVETMQRLLDLAKAGATVVFVGEIPRDVPGLHDFEKRREQLNKLVDSIKFGPKTGASEIRTANVGSGTVVQGPAVDAMLDSVKLHRETMVDKGLRFIRRKDGNANVYFIANRSEKAVNGWTGLGVDAKSAVLLDPMFENRAGVAPVRQNEEWQTQVYLQLQPGESCILKTFDSVVEGKPWQYSKPGNPTEVAGTWNVKFLDGGPDLPAGFETKELGSWTSQSDAAKAFSGTASYTIEFDNPANGDAGKSAGDWLLDLGKVAESARVKLNGKPVTTLWAKPFQVAVGEYLRPGKNVLEIEVTNLGANRIADMDRRKVNWKYFYDANVASNTARGVLNAATWPVFDSGLIGPVRLVPLSTFTSPAAPAPAKE